MLNIENDSEYNLTFKKYPVFDLKTNTEFLIEFKKYLEGSKEQYGDKGLWFAEYYKVFQYFKTPAQVKNMFLSRLEATGPENEILKSVIQVKEYYQTIKMGLDDFKAYHFCFNYSDEITDILNDISIRSYNFNTKKYVMAFNESELKDRLQSVIRKAERDVGTVIKPNQMKPYANASFTNGFMFINNYEISLYADLESGIKMPLDDFMIDVLLKNNDISNISDSGTKKHRSTKDFRSMFITFDKVNGIKTRV